MAVWSRAGTPPVVQFGEFRRRDGAAVGEAIEVSTNRE